MNSLAKLTYASLPRERMSYRIIGLPNEGASPRRTLRGITGLHVIEEKASVKNGKIDEYRVTLELTFILEG